MVAVSPGARDEAGKLIPLDLRVDPSSSARVVGHEVKIDGEDLLIMKESDVMGVVERDRSRKAAEIPLTIPANSLERISIPWRPKT